MLIGTLIPGATYSSGTFSIPISSLNSILSSDWTVTGDSAERLYFALLECLRIKCLAGTVTQPLLGMEIGQRAVSDGIIETASGTFTNQTVYSYVWNGWTSTAPATATPDVMTSV
jgi:hypothetical protein